MATLIVIAASAWLPCAAWGGALKVVAPPGVTLPPPDPESAPIGDQQDYRISPLDTLEITVYPADTLNRTLQVDGSGKLDFPLVGQVDAFGRTSHELGNLIAARLKQTYLQDPQVTVVVKQSLNQRFTVEGDVKTPGVYPLAGEMTLLRAIATAQGLNRDAKTHDLVIFRMVNRRRMAAIVSLADVRSGKVDDPTIYPGDVIVVPASASKRALDELIAATPLLYLARP